MYLTSGLQRAVQQTPDRVVTIFGERRRTYREFADRVARLAGALCALGMKTGDRVGMLALNSDRYLEYLMATWWGGGVLNPVNTHWAVPEVAYSLDDCDTRILFVDDQFLPMVEGIRAATRHPPVFIYAGEQRAPEGMLACDELIASSRAIADAGRGGHDLACIMYTSGTTGLPKGVMQTHLNLWSSCVQHMAAFPQFRNSRDMHILPLFHSTCLSRALCGFIAGESHVLIPVFDPAVLLATIEREQVVDTALVPAMILAMLAHPDFSRHDLSSLQRLMYGAAPAAGEMIERLLERLPGLNLLHSYGLTEACPIVSTNPPENHGAEARRSGLSRSAGHSAYGVLVRIVDEEGREAPRGQVGEVTLRGPNVMQGYWNKPEETARALRNGWLFTGDAGYMDEQGHLFIVGRLQDMNLKHDLREPYWAGKSWSTGQ